MHHLNLSDFCKLFLHQILQKSTNSNLDFCTMQCLATKDVSSSSERSFPAPPRNATTNRLLKPKYPENYQNFEQMVRCQHVNCQTKPGSLGKFGELMPLSKQQLFGCALLLSKL
jgi:hypothetical protein